MAESELTEETDRTGHVSSHGDYLVLPARVSPASQQTDSAQLYQQLARALSSIRNISCRSESS